MMNCSGYCEHCPPNMLSGSVPANTQLGHPGMIDQQQALSLLVGSVDWNVLQAPTLVQHLIM